MQGPVTVNNSDAYLAACLAGLGIIQVRAEAMPVNIVYPHRRHLSRRVQVFMNWLADVLRSYLHARA